MAISHYLDDLLAHGIYSFSGVEAAQALGSSVIATRAALRRLRHKGEIAMPFRGFYVIVTPEYRKLGCLPANQFIPALMDYLNEPYYAGLLTAVEHYGAANHHTQTFQIVMQRARKTEITCGGVRIDFIVRKNVAVMPTQDFITPRGYLKVSTPEATAFDLAGYPHHTGGLGKVATVLTGLAASLDAMKLANIAELSPVAWSQRLGFLLDLIGKAELTEGLSEYIKSKNAVPIPLSSSLPHKGFRQDPRWRLIPNEKVELDI